MTDQRASSKGRRTEVAPAVLCMLGGTAVLVLNDAIVKSLTEHYATGQLLFLRGLFVWPWILLFAMGTGGLSALRITSFRGQALRSVCVICSSFLFVTGLRHLSLTDAIAVAFTGPLFITAMAPLILSERVGWRRWLAVGVGFLGVLFMLRPGGDTLQWAVLFPLGAAVFGALRDLITRRISNTETTVGVLAVTTTAVMLSGLATALFTEWNDVRVADIKMFAASGVLIAIAHTLMIEAFRRGEAALVAPFKYSSLLWGTLFGFLMFEDLPSRWTIIGAAIIVAAGLYVLHRERKAQGY